MRPKGWLRWVAAAVSMALLAPVWADAGTASAGGLPTVATPAVPVEGTPYSSDGPVPGTLSPDSPTRTKKAVRDNPAMPNPKAPAVNSDSSVAPEGDVIPGQYIVRVARGRGVSAVAAGLSTDGYGVETLADGALKYVLVNTTPDDATAKSDLLSSDGVADVWEDRRVSVASDQSDPPWGLDRIDQASLPLDSHYKYDSDGTGVTAYIVDTGVRGTHEDFGGRVTSGWNGTDDAGNGDSDCHGHGTHVAGTVAGTLYGVAKKATIVPVRVLSCSGSGATSTIVSGLNWIVTNHAAGVPAVINMSLGGGAESATDTAVASAVADGIVTVVAAGNDNADACGYSPARAPSAITVGALTSTDEKASYSNYGSCLDIWAPGSSVLSADYSADTGGRTLSGTSMASPHVAGAAARLLSFNNSLTVEEVTSILTSLTVDVSGRNLLQSPLYTGTTAPSAPTGVTATARNAAAELSWTTPASGVAAYKLVFPDSSSVTLGRSTTTYLKTGLANNTPITVTVSALNAAGWGPTTSVSVTPYDDGTPLAPTISRVGTGHGWIAADVTLPSAPAGGPVTSITLRATPETGPAVTTTVDVAPSATSAIVRLTGLESYSAYTVDAEATNTVGPGLWSGAQSVTVDGAVNVGKGGSVQVGFSFGTFNLGPQTRLPTVVDDTNGRVFAGVPSGAIVSIEKQNHFTATGSISSGQGMFLLHDSVHARTFAIPYYQNSSNVKELTVSGSTVSAATVATTGVSTTAAVIDQSNSELIVAGNGLKRYSIGASGSLTGLSVPAISLGSDYVTSIAVHGDKVAFSSTNGGWVKLWDRTAGTITAVASGIERPGTVIGTDAGFVVAPDKGDSLRSFGWDGTPVAVKDTFIGSRSGVVSDGLYGDMTAATGAAVDGDTVAMIVNGNLMSVEVPSLEINAQGSSGGVISASAGGAVLTGNWVFDIGADLRSRYRSFAPGSWANAAMTQFRGTTLGSVVVETTDGFGVRLLEPTTPPRNVTVDAADGSARVTWQAPETTNAEGKSSWVTGAGTERPYKVDVIVQPGNRVVPWTGGPFDLVVDGLDPSVQHTVTVRTVSPGGTSESAPVSVTAASTASRPDPPTGVAATGSTEGCVNVSWAPVSGATSGYRIEILGHATTTSAAAGATSAAVCGLKIGQSQFPLVRARVVALGSASESVPSIWSQATRAVAATVMAGAPGDNETDESMGVFAMVSSSVDENEQDRSYRLHLSGEDFQRSVPVPAAAVDILGFDPVEREVFLGVCSYAPRVIAVSVDDATVRGVQIPTGPVKICGSRYDPVLRAIWMTNGYWANTDLYSVGGANAYAVSVDSPGLIVKTTNVTCRKDGYAGDLWVGDGPLFVTDAGRAAIECMNVDSASNVMNFYRAVDLGTGTVIRDSTSWFGLVGATINEGFVTVDDTKTTLHGMADATISSSSSLDWGTSSLKRPTGFLASTWAQVVRKNGSYVVSGDRFGHHILTDLTAMSSRAVGQYVSAGNNSTLGTAVAEDGTVVQTQTDGDVSMVSPGGSKLLDVLGRAASYESVDAGGRRPGGYFSGSVPSKVLPFGPGDSVVLSYVRVPDNMGVPTAEDLATVLVHIRGAARPVISSRSADSVVFSAPATEGLAAGSATKWEKWVEPTSYEVRDATGTLRCSSSSTTCTAAGRFGAGATVKSLTTAGGTSFFSASDAVASGTSLPAAPRIFPWTTTQANQAALWTNPLPAGATGRDIYCRGSSGSLTKSGAVLGSTRETMAPGFLLCRARGTTSTVQGPWGPPVLVQVETAGVRTSAMAAGTGTLSLGGTGSSGRCSTTGSSVSLVSGETKTAAEGSWRCVVTLGDGTSISRVVWSAGTPVAPGAVAVTRSGSNLDVSFSVADSNAALVSVTVRCTDLAPVTVTSLSAMVSGASGTGPRSCTTESNYRDPVTDELTAGVRSTPVSTVTHSLGVAVTGSGSVVSEPAGIDCTGSCTVNVDHGLPVTLTATPAEGWKIAGWTGAGCNGSTCTVTMTADVTIDVRFARSMSVGLTQGGNGTVTSTGSVMSTNADGGQSSTTVAAGTTITLTATASAGWELIGWEGADCAGPTCTVTVNTDTTIRAVFGAVTPPATIPVSTPATTPATTPPQGGGQDPAVTTPPVSTPTVTNPPKAPAKLKTIHYVRRLRTRATKLSASTLASRTGITYARGSVFTIRISPFSAGKCTVKRTALRRSPASVCRLTLTIVGRTTKKVVALTVS